MFTSKLFLVSLLFPYFWTAVVEGGQVFNFHGNNFILHDSSLDERLQDVTNDVLSLKNVYKFRFKTIHSSGIFLFSEGTRGDFISIVLLHCKLRVVIRRQMQKDSPPDELHVIAGNNLCDGNWHSVHFVRNGRKACVDLDNTKNCYRIPGNVRTLDVDLHTFIAGIDKASIKPSIKQHIRQVPNYRGCLRSVMLNKTNILKAAMKKAKHTKIYGSHNKGCRGQVLRNVIGFKSGDSLVTLETPAKRALTVSFQFRTYHENGLLFYSQSALFVKLLMVSGKLELQPYVQGPQGIQHQIKFKVGKHLADGNWHHVRVHINSNGFSLSVDKDEISWKKPKQLRKANLLKFKAIVFGYGLGFKSFIGCLNQIKINKRLINGSISHSEVEFRRCPIQNLCFPNPCKHEAKCINTAIGFSCDCSGLHYTGKLCDDPLYRSSCQEYAKLGLSRDAMCSVLPNKNISAVPFKLMCSVIGSRMMAAVIDNDQMEWQRIEERKHAGYTIGSYLNIHYSLDLRNIKAVISGSRKCYQYVGINQECPMLNVTQKNQPVAYWITSSKKISNPITITKNEYIREKSLLPVINIQFPSDAAGCYYKVGPLRCIGTRIHSKPLPASVDLYRFLKNVCNPLVQPNDHDNRANFPGDDVKVDTGFPSLKAVMTMKEEKMPSTSLMKEDPETSVSATEEVAVTAKARETSPFIINTKQKIRALTAEKGKRFSQTALTERWEFLAAVIVGSAFLILMMGFVCASALIKRKMKAERGLGRTPKEPGMRKSVCDDVKLQPETDLWMKINSCGYNVKTGKITYGRDIYRVS